MPTPDIFILDDEELVAASLGRLLTSAGYSCETFRTAPEVVEALGRGARPRLLLADLILDGGATSIPALLAAAETREVRIIVLSASSGGAAGMMLRRAQVEVGAVLSKPCDPSRIITAVMQHAGPAKPLRKL